MLRDWQKETIFPDVYKELEGEVEPDVVRAIASIFPEPLIGKDTKFVNLFGQTEPVFAPQPDRLVTIY